MECETCRYYRVKKDGTPVCRYKGSVTKDKQGKCEQRVRRWPDGITIPDFKEP